MKKEPILSAKDVEIQFSLRGRKLKAIRNCSLDLYEGETLAIVGESGSGKSVFTKSFVGMLDANGSITNGSIMYKGKDISKYKTEKEWSNIRGKEIAMVMQDPMTSLNPLKVIGKQIQESIELHQGLKGEDANINILHILAPFMAVALPSTILISGISVLFDVIPILSGGFGSFLYFLIIVFIGGMSLSGSVDILGIGIMLSPMTEQLKKFDSNYSGAFTIFGNDAYSKVFCFQELDWSLGSLLSRILLIAASICIIIIAAKLFEFAHEDSIEEIEENLLDSDKLKNNMTRVHKDNFVLSRISAGSPRCRLKDLLYAELGLVVRNTNAFILFMYAAVIGLYLLLPLDSVKGLIISLLWILPLSILSEINTRNIYDSTREMIQSTAYFNRMEILTHYLCGVIIIFLPNVPLICKGLLLGQHIDITMIIAGSIFIPALALFLGAWSKSLNLFQGLYLFIWYIGIGGNIYILNFTGLCNAGPGISMRIFVVYSALSFILLAGTYIKRLIELKTK